MWGWGWTGPTTEEILTKGGGAGGMKVRKEAAGRSVAEMRIVSVGCLAPRIELGRVLLTQETQLQGGVRWRINSPTPRPLDWGVTQNIFIYRDAFGFPSWLMYLADAGAFEGVGDGGL